MKKDKLLIIIIGATAILSLAQLYISHSLAAAGEKVAQLEEKARRYRFENAILEQEIAKVGGLTRIAKEAEKIGLIPASQAIQLTSQLPVAWGY